MTKKRMTKEEWKQVRAASTGQVSTALAEAVRKALPELKAKKKKIIPAGQRRILIRMPKELKALADAFSKKNKISLNQMCITLLASLLASEIPAE